MSETQEKAPIWVVDQRAVAKGGALGGDYLESIGKADVFNHVTKDEWHAFCSKIVGGAFLAAIGDVHDGQIPF